MSQANYILICSGRGDILAADAPAEKVVAAMRCAAQFTAFNQLIRPHKMEALRDDVSAVSKLQHEMMEALPNVGRPYAEELIEKMFAQLDALEKKIGS